MEAYSAWYGWFNLGTDPGNPGNMGETELNLYRPFDDVTKEVDVEATENFDVATYTISIAPNKNRGGFVLRDLRCSAGRDHLCAGFRGNKRVCYIGELRRQRIILSAGKEQYRLLRIIILRQHRQPILVTVIHLLAAVIWI